MLASAQQQRLRLRLKKHVAFTLLPDEAIQTLAGQFDLVTCGLGDTLFGEGEVGTEAYLVEAGKARIVRQAGSGKTVSLGTFAEGDFFAGHSRPEHWQRSSSARAASDLVLFRIRRGDFEDVLRQYRGLLPYFDKSLEEAAWLRFLRLTKLFAGLPFEHVGDLLADLEECAFKANEVIFHEGAKAERFFVIRSGAVHMSKTFEGGERLVAELGEEDFFGERGLLVGTPRKTTALAQADVSCYSLGKNTFAKIMMAAPLHAQLTDRLQVAARQVVKAAAASEMVWLPLPRQNLVDQDQQDRALDQSDLVKYLRLGRLLKEWPPQDAPFLIRQLQEARFQKGQTIVKEGEQNTRFCIIRTGAAKVVRKQQGIEKTIAVLGPEDYFGEWSLTETVAAPFSVIASENSECFQIEPDRLKKLEDRIPDLRERLAPRLTNPRQDRPKSAESSKAEGIRRITTSSSKRRARFPWHGQCEEADCGPACLAMVARFHGKCVSFKKIRHLCHLGRKGTSMLNFAEAAAALGFSWEALQADFSQLLTFLLPAVAHWKDSHYVVVYRASPRHVLVADPAVGLVRMTRRLFEEGWRGRVVLLGKAGVRGQESGVGDEERDKDSGESELA